MVGPLPHARLQLADARARAHTHKGRLPVPAGRAASAPWHAPPRHGGRPGHATDRTMAGPCHGRGQAMARAASSARNLAARRAARRSTPCPRCLRATIRSKPWHGLGHSMIQTIDSNNSLIQTHDSSNSFSSSVSPTRPARHDTIQAMAWPRP